MKRKKRRRLRAALEALMQVRAAIAAERDDLAYRLVIVTHQLATATRHADKMTAERDNAQRHLAEVYEVLDEGSADTDRAPDGLRRSAAQRVKLLVEQLRCPADVLEALRLEALRRERDEAAAEVERLRAALDCARKALAQTSSALWAQCLDGMSSATADRASASTALANGAAVRT